MCVEELQLAFLFSKVFFFLFASIWIASNSLCPVRIVFFSPFIGKSSVNYFIRYTRVRQVD